MGSLVPGQALIYERANGMVYARYRDAPYNKRPRWVVGSSGSYEDFFFPPPKEEKVDWQDIESVAKQNVTLQTQLDKLLTLYYTIKDEYKENGK